MTTNAGNVTEWTSEDVDAWLRSKDHDSYAHLLTSEHKIDGRALLMLTEADLKKAPINIRILGDVKRLWFDINEVQKAHLLLEHSHVPHHLGSRGSGTEHTLPACSCLSSTARLENSSDSDSSQPEHDLSASSHVGSAAVNPHRVHGAATNLQPEVKKALLSMGYLFGVTLLTSMTMVIVHDRVPDMKKYPPLPDIFLDNVPYIPWAFQMCEVTGTLLLLMWLTVLFFHKHRFILLRRFFSLSGTVFLLRCVTMLITSLSVPGTHLKCNPRPYGDMWAKIQQAFVIWKAAGMSIQGVRSCGDYMFSGHTVALTMLNFFITEYTPRKIYFLHTFSWLLNMFGIFFILAAHEHYSIDVFVAFYITSRLFLYYHTLANNRALMHLDSKRTRIWFPLFSYFESQVDGIVPNVYEWPLNPSRLWEWAQQKFEHCQAIEEKKISAQKAKWN